MANIKLQTESGIPAFLKQWELWCAWKSHVRYVNTNVLSGIPCVDEIFGGLVETSNAVENSIFQLMQKLGSM